MAFDLKKMMQGLGNKQMMAEATTQVEREEAQPDKSGDIPNLITKVVERLLGKEGIPPHPLSGSDKLISWREKGMREAQERPGWFMAAKAPDTIIFLTIDQNGKGVLVNKPDLYSSAASSVTIESIRDKRVLNDIALRLNQILTMEDKDFVILPRSSWSWQIK